MEKQLIFRQKYVDQLRELVDNYSATEHYKSSEFVYDKEQVLMLPNVIKPIGLLEKMNFENDLDSAIQLYEAYSGLALLQAADERLWSYLSHVELYPYMIKRWSKVYGGSISDANNYILDHWFINSSSQSGLLRHALSGLWWSVHLSVDESRIDKYELTKILFRQLDFPTRTLGTYKLGRHKEAVIGILEYIKDNEELFEKNFERKTRFITKYINQIGGTRPIANYDRVFFKTELEKASNLMKGL